MYLNPEANISITRTVPSKYVFLFPSQKIRTKKILLLEVFLLPLNPLNCQGEEQNCLAERQFSLGLCRVLYFLLKWCFRSCLTLSLRDLLGYNLLFLDFSCHYSWFHIALAAMVFLGKTHPGSICAAVGRICPPELEWDTIFMTSGASQLLWATDFWQTLNCQSTPCLTAFS